MPLTTGEKWGWGLLLGGLAVAGGGGIALAVARGRRNAGLSGPLGHLVRQNKSKASGMVMKEYRSTMSTKERVEHIQDMIAKGVRDPDFVQFARRLVRNCPPRDRLCEGRTIDAYVRTKRYTSDIGPHVFVDENGKRVFEAVDLYGSPQRNVEAAGFDCDDATILTLGLATAIGVEGKMRLSSPDKGGEPTHIYSLLQSDYFDGSKMVVSDATLPNAKFGDEHPHAEHWDYPA